MKKGIDVSYANGTVDWNRAKQQIDFAILRCGFGMDIASQDDAQFRRNVEECIRLNIPFGVYLYSYADNVEKAQSEAEHVLRLISNYKSNLQLYVWYDLEDKKLADLSMATLSNIITAFCNKIEGNGLGVGIYASNSWLRSKIDMAIQNKYMIWSAGYGRNDGQPHEDAKYNHPNVVIWQYSSNGNVDGVGRCDVNYYYRDDVQSSTQRTSTSQTTSPQSTKKSNEEIAREVIRGEWGNGQERKQRLVNAGYDPNVIQDLVNRGV